jgi:hypothetical protein
MKKATLSLFVLLICLTFATMAYSQNRPDEGSIGISASFQGNQTNLMLPIWTTEDIVIAPVFGVVHEADSFTTLNLGVKPRFYRDLGSNFASYFGFQGLLQYTSPEVGDEITNFLLGANGGGEYYLSNRFSVGVEGQLNLLIRDNTENRLATGAAVTASYYF